MSRKQPNTKAPEVAAWRANASIGTASNHLEFGGVNVQAISVAFDCRF